MAELLGEETLLVDATRGPAEIAAGLQAALGELGCDLAVFLDVGGDALAEGGEPGLASPLCDALLLAAAEHLAQAGTPVLGGVVGLGCDGELTPDEVLALLGRLEEAGGLRGRIAIGAAVAEALEAAVAAVPTEASALALRAFHGERGRVEIRGGRRTVDLRAEAAATWSFDPSVAVRTVARLAAAVRDARDLEHANDLLHALGVRTELDYERERASAADGIDDAHKPGAGRDRLRVCSSAFQTEPRSSSGRSAQMTSGCWRTGCGTSPPRVCSDASSHPRAASAGASCDT